jgi:hypothetical protein
MISFFSTLQDLLDFAEALLAIAGNITNVKAAIIRLFM